MHDQLPAGSEIRHSWAHSDRFVPRSFVRPLQRFMDTEASGAIFMLVAAVAALVWANSPWWRAQQTLWETDLNIELGHLAHIELTLVEWINDALMAIFFFVVGLEIKRELVHGELRDPRKAALPAIAALGGMIFPAVIYLLFNGGTDASKGWGIPMATDIAFAVAVVSLVGPRIPSRGQDLPADAGHRRRHRRHHRHRHLLHRRPQPRVAGHRLRHARPRRTPPASWRSVPCRSTSPPRCSCGSRSTSPASTPRWPGCRLGLLTPAWSFLDPRHFASRATALVEEADSVYDDGVMTEEEYELNQAELENLSLLVSESQSPLERLEHKLQGWVAFVIVPLFAFSNAGVRLTKDALDGLATDKVVLGVAVGLIVGKTIGVFSFTWLAARLGIGNLPRGVTYRHVFGLAVTAGIGFTVALFVAGLAFDPGGGFTDSAKIGILGGSLIAGILGYLMLRLAPRPPTPTSDGE